MEGILPIAATGPSFVKLKNVFHDSDSEDEAPRLQKEKNDGGYRSKRTRAEIEKMVKEDDTIYKYDEVYDEVQKQRSDVAAAKKAKRAERKPRYIHLMKKAKDERKKENKRRLYRQLQKEREAEGDEFANKEVIITRAYQEKLNKMKAAEEAENLQDRFEAIGDVTKQRDLSGIYCDLYEKVVRF